MHHRFVLMVAYHFPPFAGSTGFLRTLSFARHLPESGWNPLVLTAHQRAYPKVDSSALDDIPGDCDVTRAFAFDVRRDFAIGGRYPRWLATPDPWNSWILFAVIKALRLIRRHNVDAVWTTYPIASAVLIGLVLKKLTRRPWVLDLRDPLLYEGWPSAPGQRRVHAWIERHAFRLADRIVVTTPGARRLYQARYPDLPGERVVLIPNGYDDVLLDSARTSHVSVGKESRQAPVRLVHGGLLEVPDRDPSALFVALGKLKRQGSITKDDIQVMLRASGREQAYLETIARCGIDDLVVLAPPIPYRQALAEMLDADGLLLFQGSACNNQIPAKAYEYFASGRPVIGLVDRAGDTCALLEEVGIPYIWDIESPDEIAAGLIRFLQDFAAGRAHGVPTSVANGYSRRSRAAEFAQLLDAVVSDCLHGPASEREVSVQK